MPPSQVWVAFVPEFILEAAVTLQAQLREHTACKDKQYHLDVQAALREELVAAYNLLSTEQYHRLWDFCNPHLVEAIRTRDTNTVAEMAFQFRDALDVIQRDSETTGADGKPPPTPPATITLDLAWAIIVDSALLTDRFLEDMRHTHAAKGCACAPEGWAPLYLPEPPLEVCQLFNDYVRCRWPLHVFALDPVTDDQNVGESFRLRRETQLALSLAFVSGNMSAGSFSRYVRRIEQDIDTIALNRTAVGFSHGDDTFGWRFYPRVQTPPVAGNLEVIFRDLLVGGISPGRTLRQRRLEPGIRECVALVIMPSIIPSVDLDVVSNWFRLDHPKCKTLDLKDALRLSRSIRAIQDRSGLACDHDRYRAGDGGLVLRRLDQISERMPLQHQLVDVPAENTHGGFELLSTGVTDLAPELLGFYGAPGINPNDDTALFLVGDNFSVHQTRVVVGGRMLDPSCPVLCTAAGTCPACPPAAAAPAAAAAAPTAAAAPCACGKASADAGGGDPGVQLAGAEEDADPGVVQAQLLRRRRPLRGSTTTTTGPTVNNVATPTVTVSPTVSPTVSDTVSPTITASPTVSVATAAGAATVTGAGAAAVVTPAPTPVYQVELLSRQVMRVVIPKGVYAKDGMVDIHIATPYGVSPHLSVPLICPTPPPPAYGYSMPADARGAKIPYGFVTDPLTKVCRLALIGKPTGTLRIDWNEPTGSVLKLASAKVTFKAGDRTAVVIAPLAFRDGHYEISDAGPEKSLTGFSLALLNALGQLGIYSPDKPLPASLPSATVEVMPLSPPAPVPPLLGPEVLPPPVPEKAGPELKGIKPAPILPAVPLVPAVPTHDVKSIPVTATITVQFEQLAVGVSPGR